MEITTHQSTLGFLSNFQWWQVLIFIVVILLGIAGLIVLISKKKFNIKTKFMEIGSSSNSKGMIPSEHRDYLIFSLVLFRYMSQVKDYIRVGCLQNGFHLMNDSEWANYKKDKYEIITTRFQKFFGENLRGLSLIKADEYINNSEIHSTVRENLSQLYDMLRDISKEQYSVISKKSQELHDFYDLQKGRILSNSCAEKDILYILLDYGQRMVEIHEIKTRTLIDLQMTRVEDKLSFISDVFLTSFLELLSKLLTDK